MSSIVSPSLRSRVRSGVEPLARLFGRVGLTPNSLTLIGFGIALVAAYFASTQAWLIAGVLVAFGAVFDLFDGALARATGTTSRFGAFMDSTFDRAGEAVVYIGIAIGLCPAIAAPDTLILQASSAWAGPIVAMAAMATAFMVSYVRTKSESLGFSPGTGMANVGLAPREVRVVILVLGLVIAGLLQRSMFVDYPAGVVPAPDPWWFVLVGSLGLIAILATLTTSQRIYHVYRQAKSQEDGK